MNRRKTSPHRSSLQALDSLWMGEEPKNCSPDTLAADLQNHPDVREHFAHLARLDGAVAQVLDAPATLSKEDLALLGLEEEDLREAQGNAVPEGFEARVHHYIASGIQAPRPVHLPWWHARRAGGLLSAAAAVVLVALVWKIQPVEAPQDRHPEFTPRGIPELLDVDLSALCTTAPTKPPKVTSAESPDGVLRCNFEDAAQVVLSDPHARNASVLVAMVQLETGGKVATVPYSPNPSSPKVVWLGESAERSPVGFPHRLNVNHKKGEGWLIALGTGTPITWKEAKEVLTAWESRSTLKNPTPEALKAKLGAVAEEVLAQPLEFVTIRAFSIEEGSP